MLQFLIKFTVLVLLANDIKSNLFKNLDLFTVKLFQSFMNFFFSAEHKRRYFEECWLMEIVFFLLFSSHCGSQLYSTVLLLIFFKISFVFSRGKKLIQVWKNFGAKK